MTAVRVLLGALGLAAVARGGWLLLDLGPADLVDALVWLAGGVLLHDAVLAPVVALVGVLLARLLPGPERAPVVVGAVLAGTLTLAVLPVLGRFGAKPDDPYLLDRPYLLSWLLLTGALLTGSVVVAVLRRRTAGRP
jgi:hypothetical protein